MTKIKPFKSITCFIIVFLSLIVTNHEQNLFWFKNNPEPIKEVTKVAKAVDPKQLACLAKNIFYEANGESVQGQAAVARVVMNRINYGFASNPCNVIYQTNYIEKQSDEGEIYKEKRCQFSWVCEGKGEPNKNSPGYIQAKAIAYDVLAFDAYDDVVPKSALFFHNTSITPDWPYNEAKKIGNHIFYSKHKKKIVKKHKPKSEQDI